MLEQNFFVYILKSREHNRIYIGSTSNVSKRLRLHNSGKVRSTKAYKPWLLLETHGFGTRGEAVKAEMHYKSGQQREFIKRRHGL